MIDLNDLAKDIHDNAKAHGFYDEPPTFGGLIALLHSEASEALEAHRDGHRPAALTYDPKGKPVGIPSELADLIIRALDMCGFYGIDIQHAVTEKIAFNRTRPFRHGKARL